MEKNRTEFSDEMLNYFLWRLRENQVEIHAITVYRNGEKILSEAYAPYEMSALHPLYSVTKSFLSVAVGYLVTEKKINLNQPWLDYFPEYQSMADETFKTVTIENLLTMSMGQDAEAAVHGNDDWAENVVSKKCVYEPGTRFFYNSMCSHLLSLLVQKITGEKVVELLEKRLLEPLGITDYYWQEDPHGHNAGGFGLHLKNDDLAKFGLCCLQNGRYQGKLLIPEEWLNVATVKQIENADAYPEEHSANRQGYGYQFWMCTHGAYRCTGLHGQICYINKQMNLVIALNSAATGSQAVMDCLNEAIECPQSMPAFDLFHINTIAGEDSSVFADKKIIGKHVALKNEAGITEIVIAKTEEGISIQLEKEGTQYTLLASCGKWRRQNDCMQGFSEFIVAECLTGGRTERVLLGSYGWKTETTLSVEARGLDNSSVMNFNFEIDGKYLVMHYAVRALWTTFPAFDVTFVL